MKRLFILVLGILCFSVSEGQGGWSIQTLPNMPYKTSNNAVASAIVNDTPFVYSFFGIDTTKMWSGIHSKSFRYNTITQVWDTIPNVPDSLGGLIAAGASTINNKIYIIGGYHVYSNNNEISANEVHIYDPITNSYSRGKNIPIEIDDHVQLTYKDSLIYVISGWTSSIGGGNNTNAVQVYDVAGDQWYQANDMPNSSTYKVFGASGAIVNDTIYFAGGARYATNFPLVNIIRKGVVDSSNPLSINWSMDTVINNFRPYRSVSLSIDNKVFWFGGSDVSYNYNGIAYNGSGGVSPVNYLTEYNSKTNKWEQYSPFNLNMMDFRGSAQISKNTFILCGGMENNQNVSNKSYMLSYDTTYLSSTDSIDIVEDTTSFVSEHNLVKMTKINYVYYFKHADITSLELIDLFGRRVKLENGNSMSVLGVEQGLYYMRMIFKDQSLRSVKILVE